MPSDPAPALLAALQFGDSFFPGGGTAFSWGLESLHVDGAVHDAAQVGEIACAWIEQRWAGAERSLLVAAHRAWRDARDAGDEVAALTRVFELDALCEASTPQRGLREASRKLGATQLRVHDALGVSAARRLLDAVRAARTPGHLPVVQGVLWCAHGLEERDAESVSAFGLATSIAGAAIRLGLIGHLDAQRLLVAVRTRIARVLDDPPPAPELSWSGAPAIDVAAMRHEPRTARLFAN